MRLLTAFETPAARSELGWSVLRWTLVLVIAAHGWSRLAGGGVEPFGGWLNSQGIPLGLAVAWGITLLEIVGSILMWMRRFVFPLSILYSLVYLTGIVMIHAKAGWFVVGSGRNGMEFSVLLIVALLCVGIQDIEEIAVPSPETLERFIARVEENAHVEAILEFYAEGASMRENMKPPRVGRAALAEREGKTMEKARWVRSTCVRPVLVEGDVVVVRWIFEFEWKDGKSTRMEELAYQRWEAEKIAEEQFFYDPGQLSQGTGQ